MWTSPKRSSAALHSRFRHVGFVLAIMVVIKAVMLSADGFAFAADQVGAATRVHGQATAINDGAPRDLAVQSPIMLEDQLATGTDSRLEITFTDGSLLTMGADGSLKVNSFVFQQPDQRNTLQLLAVGAFKLVSGAVNKPEGKNISVVTPVGALAIRGTDIWAGPIDGAFGVFLIDGQVTVTTNGGAVTLTEPGSGTNISDINTAPGAVTQWPQEKVDRALAAVAFQ